MISAEREGLVEELRTGTTSEQSRINICRLCGQCRCDVIPIFSEEAHRKHVLLKIQTRLLIQISASDPLPKNACVNCLEKLDSLWDFFELCRKAQIMLREMFITKRRDERATLWKDQVNIGTSHPPHCSLNFITHQTTQDTSNSASGNKRIKLEHVPFIKKELVCLDGNSRTVLTSTVASSAGSRVSYRNVNRDISAEPSKNSNVSVRLDDQQESDKIVKKLCLSETVDAIVERNMLVLQDCKIAEGRSAVSLNVQKSDHWKAVSSDLTLGQQVRFQNVLNTKPIIDKEATLDAVNSRTVQNHYRKINAESSSNSEISVRSDHKQETDTTVKMLCVDEIVRRNVSILQDCDSGEGIDGRSSGSPSVKMSDHLEATSPDLIDDSLAQQGKLQDVLQTKLVIEKQASVDHINSSAVQENRSSPIISISHDESPENVLLDRTDSQLTCTSTAEGRYSPVRSVVSESEIQRGVSLDGTQQVEKSISMLSCGKNQEALLSVYIDNHVSQQQINESSSGRNLSESINQARILLVNTGASNFQHTILRNLLSAHENVEKEGRATLQKEGTDTHLRKSVSKEEISSTLVEKAKFSALNNPVSDSDTVNIWGKLHDNDNEGNGGGDHGSSECDNSFSCHDCGSIFSCKNSLTDHIFKQHNHGGQTNTLHVTPQITVTLDCSDSSINKLSSADFVSIHNTNTCDNVLKKLEKNKKSLLAKGKRTETAQESNCNVPSIDDNDCPVIYNSTSSNTTDVKSTETELKPTTLDEARLMCKKYSERICETSGKNPKINMIGIRVELPSGNFYTGSNVINRSFFKPFIVLNDSQYDCQICKATLNTRTSIVKHIGKHFNLFPFWCKFCDRRFTLQGSANQHLKTHCTGTKLICERCGSVCKSAGLYTLHMLKHDKPFSCHDCGERFGSKIRVKDHILKVHLKIRSYLCKICGKAYFHESNVLTHMVFAHAERKIVCQHCGKMYFRNNMLKEHIKRWHT
ncbi:uncharacterized protein [Anabrus simplex]|uniref:uncharacterized protein n=1 Tax=Anabrus simplex TaxID=316456 RepID=UPI0035A32D32